jgi:hypothetical protein
MSEDELIFCECFEGDARRTDVSGTWEANILSTTGATALIKGELMDGQVRFANEDYQLMNDGDSVRVEIRANGYKSNILDNQLLDKLLLRIPIRIDLNRLTLNEKISVINLTLPSVKDALLQSRIDRGGQEQVAVPQ